MAIAVSYRWQSERRDITCYNVDDTLQWVMSPVCFVGGVFSRSWNFCKYYPVMNLPLFLVCRVKSMLRAPKQFTTLIVKADKNQNMSASCQSYTLTTNHYICGATDFLREKPKSLCFDRGLIDPHSQTDRNVLMRPVPSREGVCNATS